MKKFLLILLAVCLLAGFAGCSKADPQTEKPDPDVNQPTDKPDQDTDNKKPLVIPKQQRKRLRKSPALTFIRSCRLSLTAVLISTGTIQTAVLLMNRMILQYVRKSAVRNWI